jgi:hypothetical protein
MTALDRNIRNFEEVIGSVLGGLQLQIGGGRPSGSRKKFPH